MAHYREVPVGSDEADTVTVGIEQADDGKVRAAVWWPSKGDMDADEAEYDSVPAALAAAEAAKAFHGFAEVVVTLQDASLWTGEWGTLAKGREPFGRIDEDLLSENESYALAAGIEESRDA